MAELKTKKNENSVEGFLDGVADERKRRDSYAIIELMKEATGADPKMWGGSIIGFGDQHYKYESGHEADWFLVGFSPRKQSLVLYGVAHNPDLLSELGKHKTGKGCLYINRLEDIDLGTLREMIVRSVQQKEE